MNVRKSITVCVAAIGVVYSILVVGLVWQPLPGEKYPLTISSDGRGYYMYLPSIFIAGTFGDEAPDYRYILDTPYGPLNKYNAGTPLLVAPFFLTTCLYYEILDLPYDGYGTGFQKTATIAALIYFLAGIAALAGLLRRLKFRTSTIVVVLCLLALGTNLLYYTTAAPAFSHVYSFFTISCFLLFAKRYMEGRRRSDLLLSAVFLGLILLIRPFNVLVLLALPLLAENPSHFLSEARSFFRRPAPVISSVAIVVAIACIQQVLWYIQTGELVLYGYHDEGFYFGDPQFAEVLFGFRKGLFVYTPALLLIFPGMIAAYRHNRYRFAVLGLFTLVIVYFISSWWNWYFGSSFGHRAFIDFYPVLFIPVAYCVDAARRKWSKVAIALFVVVCVGLNLFQSHQYRMGILLPADMSFAKYRYVFGKLDERYRHVLGGVADIEPFHSEWTVVLDTVLPSMRIQGQEEIVLLELALDTAYVNGRDSFLELEMGYTEKSEPPEQMPVLIDFRLKGGAAGTYYHIANPVKDVPVFTGGQQRDLRFTLILPVRRATDSLRISLRNPGGASFLIEDVRLRTSVFR